MQQHLILVPTELERGRIEPVILSGAVTSPRVALCGFGPAVAAARTAGLIAAHRPERVLLVGIAGRFADRLAIGQAYVFDRVACHGIGAGSGAAFTPAGSMGWTQWPGDASAATSAIGDSLPAATGGLPATAARADLLLSACAASASDDDVRSRVRMYPEAAAEDMEGFAVAAACRLAGVPLTIIRGISNTAGDRDRSHWQVDAACRAAGELAAIVVKDLP